MRLEIAPEGFGKLLLKVKDKYGNPQVSTLENGMPEGSAIDDDLKIEYVRSYLKETLKAIKEYDCNVKAYTYWSFLDNYEWNLGYT